MRAEDIAPRTWLLGTVAGWALLIWLLALVGMGRSVGKLADDPSLQPALPELRRSPPPRLGPFTQYSEIVSRPLFSDDRRPKPFSLQPEGEGENTNAFDFVLTSVMLTPGLRLAILQPSAGGDSIRIKEGESAEQAANWRLVSVAPRSATFEGPEGQRTLDLRAFDGSGGQPATPSGAVAGSAAAGAAGAAGVLGLGRSRLGFELADQHAPLVRSGLQVGPLELAGRARLDLVAQGHRVVVVDDLQRLTGTQCVQAAKNLHMALARLDGAHVDQGGLGGKHGNGPFWAWIKQMECEKSSAARPLEGSFQPSFPSSRVCASQGV